MTNIQPLSSNTTQVQKAQQRREKFAELLREMFQLNQPELDFGLYRIMHARKDDVNRFIEQDLPRITREAFASFASSDKAELEKELELACKAAKDAGFEPEASPKVQSLQAQLKDGFDLAREEGEVYDSLVTFFNRYYDEGDFLSRRVYKDGTYAIPYQGEEVVLHWANKGQYYIKSSENLRDYTFRLNPQVDESDPNPMRVHFNLVDAEAGAPNNGKESDNCKRVFLLDAEQPFELIQGELNEDGNRFEELQIRFVFRVATKEDWKANSATLAELDRAAAKAKEKPPVQGVLLSSAIKFLLGEDSGMPSSWLQLLSQPYVKANSEQADYSVLQGQLNNYTKKNSFDYFIHNNLGGFLNRELDYYIKNELLDWDDLASLKHNSSRLAPLLSKIEVIRELGENIIAFLAQLENFQKKLWLKKKFVTETQYCITLDRLSDHPRLLEQVFDNNAQCDEWTRLYALDLEQLAEDRQELSLAVLMDQQKYRFLMLDTGHFNNEFKAELLATFDDLDGQCDGLLVHSENFQALNLLQERYREQVKCIYIDPPYNTGGDGFLYKDGYQHSSWLSLVSQANSIGRGLLTDTGVITASIGIDEHSGLSSSLSETFGEKNRVAELVWEKGRKNDSRRFSLGHDYILVWAKNKTSVEDKCLPWREAKPGIRPIINKYHELKQKHGDDYEAASLELKSFYASLNKNHPCKKYSRSWHVDSRGIWRDNNITWPGGSGPTYDIPHPLTGEPCKVPDAGWRFIEDTMKEKIRDGFVEFREDHHQPPIYKSYLYLDGGSQDDNEGVMQVMGSVFYRHSQPSNDVQKGMFGDRAFENPKDHQVLARLIGYLTAPGDIVFDYFAGSGSTGHALIRELGLSRKFVLVEMGAHFDSIVLPRMKKTAYSSEWVDEVPVNVEGVSSSLKYIRLESYEDAIGNLALHRSKGQQILLKAHENSQLDAARQSYTMNYMLEVETRGSASLLNTKLFIDPTAYQLNVRSASGDETKSVNVDLLETFNYLLGLEVEHIAAPVWFDAEIAQGEFGRWQAQVKHMAASELKGIDEAQRARLWWFRTVYGINRAGQKVLVVWRNLPSVIAKDEKGALKDNAVLDAVLIEKLKIRLTSSQDDEVDMLYVNGDHNIAIPKSRSGELMEGARVQLIEEAFHRLMFANTESQTL